MPSRLSVGFCHGIFFINSTNLFALTPRMSNPLLHRPAHEQRTDTGTISSVELLP